MIDINKRIPPVKWGEEPTEAQHMVRLLNAGAAALEQAEDALTQAMTAFRDGNVPLGAMHAGVALQALHQRASDVRTLRFELEQQFGTAEPPADIKRFLDEQASVNADVKASVTASAFAAGALEALRRVGYVD